ncbi:hypothetical protein [Streptomyces sp. NPDC094032]|uniref:hypothetical protein n=1 Tax=Streptomyces sp. NPDC094032 TaxID=3155308 RepID=UPI003322EFC4
MQVTAERARTGSRRWALLPVGGALLVGAAVYERLPFEVAPPRTYALCHDQGSLTVILAVVALVLLGALLACAIGVLHLVVDPPARLTAPLVYAAVALIAVVGADGLDHVGAGIAARTEARYAHVAADACQYPNPAYQETPGWFF